MREMKVICARFNEQSKRIEVVREITNDDGSIEFNGLSFDPERLEWLSAEYEIDDLNELVEIAIYSSFMTQENRRDFPNASSARLRKRQQLSEIKQRLGAMLPSSNKEVLKIKLQEAGIPSEYVKAVDEDPVETIKRYSKFDEVRINSKREHIKAVRRGESATLRQTPSAPASKNARNPHTRPVEVKLPKVELKGGKRVT